MSHKTADYGIYFIVEEFQKLHLNEIAVALYEGDDDRDERGDE